MSDSAILLLAAGASTRMGSPKQLLPFRGKPLLRYSAERALEAGCGPVVVVLGANAAEVRKALEGLPVAVAMNQAWEGGMGSSIQTGLRAVENLSVGGAILALADQPFVTPEFFRSLVSRHHESGHPIVAASYSGTVGVPVYFSREAFPLLMALKPDQGCKGVILGNAGQALLADCPEAAYDIDTPADLETANQR